jgi:hypothetical protein
VAKDKDILWVKPDVFGNQVSLYVAKMENHIQKHAYDKYPTTEEHVFQAVTNPDAARRSLDPVIGEETCIFEKFFSSEQQRFFATVIYDGMREPLDYEDGKKTGYVTTAYFPGRINNSRNIGEVFWTRENGLIAPRKQDALEITSSADEEEK